MNESKGFTLVELMIAVAIISILMAIALPSYQESLLKSRRADAKASLLAFAQAMEQEYTTNGQYTGLATGGADTGSPTMFSIKSPIDGSAVYYNLTIVAAGASSYVLGAQPVNEQAGNGALILRSTGARGWDKDNSGGGVPVEAAMSASEWCWKDSC